MSAAPNRRTLQESLGRALNASHLRHGQGATETPLDLVAGLGAAALHVHHGADRRREPVAMSMADRSHQVDPQDALAAELGSLLAHIRDGRQHGQIPRAVHLFAQWMSYRGRFARFTDRDVLLPRLAARALHEFLSDRCTRCGGTGRLELSQGGALVRGTGRMARNAVFRQCPASEGCGGTGKPLASDTLRRMSLCLDRQRYEAEGWGASVRAAISWLERLKRRMNRPLTVQMERSIKRG